MSFVDGTNIAYLVAAVCFILAIKGLGSPRSALTGNLIGAVGMVVAALAALAILNHEMGEKGEAVQWTPILIGLAVGAVIGLVMAPSVSWP